MENWPAFIVDAIRHVPGRYELRGCFAVAHVVVEEDVGPEFREKGRLVLAAEKHGLVDRDAPRHQRANRPLMRRRTAGCDQRHAHLYRRPALASKCAHGGKEWLQRAGRQRRMRMTHTRDKKCPSRLVESRLDRKLTHAPLNDAQTDDFQP